MAESISTARPKGNRGETGRGEGIVVICFGKSNIPLCLKTRENFGGAGAEARIEALVLKKGKDNHLATSIEHVN